MDARSRAVSPNAALNLSFRIVLARQHGAGI
jgi:hypothetical protein